MFSLEEEKQNNQLKEGTQHLIIISFGWGFVGTVKCFSGINDVVLTNAHFITKCGDDTDWGQFVRKGPGKDATVNLVGDTTVNLDHRIWSAPFPHKLPATR